MLMIGWTWKRRNAPRKIVIALHQAKREAEGLGMKTSAEGIFFGGQSSRGNTLPVTNIVCVERIRKNFSRCL